VWTKQLSGPTHDEILDVATGPGDEVAVAGFHTRALDFGEGLRQGAGGADALIAKYTAEGTVSWALDFGGSSRDTGASVRQDPLGAVYATGRFGSPLELGKGAGVLWTGMYVLELGP
jgi:hypothetical protein